GERHVVDVAVEAMLAELANHRFRAGAGDFHLVERLDGGQPGDRAGLPRGPVHERTPWNCCFRAIMVSAARAAPPPLSPSLTRARAQACSSSSVVRTPLPIARP